jgi:hypothetical protein
MGTSSSALQNESISQHNLGEDIYIYISDHEDLLCKWKMKIFPEKSTAAVFARGYQEAGRETVKRKFRRPQMHHIWACYKYGDRIQSPKLHVFKCKQDNG